MARDMSKRQFEEACRRRGFRSEGVLGYYDIGNGVSASILNASGSHRAQLAYLIDKQQKEEAGKAEKEI